MTLKGSRLPVREIPPGHYVCRRCSRVVRSHPSRQRRVLCRDCVLVLGPAAAAAYVDDADREAAVPDVGTQQSARGNRS